MDKVYLVLNRAVRAVGSMAAVSLSARVYEPVVGAQIITIMYIFSFLIPILMFGMNTLYVNLSASSENIEEVESTIIMNFMANLLVITALSFALTKIFQQPSWLALAIGLLGLSRIPDLFRVILESKGKQNEYMKGEFWVSATYLVVLSLIVLMVEELRNPILAIGIVAMQGVCLIPIYYKKIILRADRYNIKITKSAWRRGAFLTISACLFATFSRLDLLMANIYLDPEEIIRLGVMLKILEIITFTPAAMWAINHVKISKAVAISDVRRFYKQAVLEAVGLVSLTTLVIVILRAPMTEYLAVKEIKILEILVLSFTAVFSIMGSATNSILSFMESEIYILRKTAVTIGVGIFGYWILHITSTYDVFYFLIVAALGQFYGGVIYDFTSSKSREIREVKWKR